MFASKIDEKIVLRMFSFYMNHAFDNVHIGIPRETHSDTFSIAIKFSNKYHKLKSVDINNLVRFF